MKSILVASDTQDTIAAIRDCFGSEYQVDVVFNKDACLTAFGKSRYEFLFIEVELLGTARTLNEYKSALQPFWQVLPLGKSETMSTNQFR